MTDLQVTHLHKEFDALQKQYGAPSLPSIYGAGCIDKPLACFVFMNPTKRNIAVSSDWQGIKAQWLGTKNVWKIFHDIACLDSHLYEKIKEMKPKDWTPSFSETLYENIASHNIYITNLGKCTEEDARPLPNHVFKAYVHLLEKEIAYIKPKVIITFGNQVSSCFLGENVCVSKCRKQFYEKEIEGNIYKVYPVFYPVGQGMRNMDLSIQDILWILSETKHLNKN